MLKGDRRRRRGDCPEGASRPQGRSLPGPLQQAGSCPGRHDGSASRIEAVTEFAEVLRTSKDPRTLAWSHIYMGRLYDVMHVPERDKAIAEYKAVAPGPVRDSRPDTKAAAEQGYQAALRSAQTGEPKTQPRPRTMITLRCSTPAARPKKRPTAHRLPGQSGSQGASTPITAFQGRIGGRMQRLGRMSMRRNQSVREKPQEPASISTVRPSFSRRPQAADPRPDPPVPGLRDQPRNPQRSRYRQRAARVPRRRGPRVWSSPTASSAATFPGSREGELTRLRASLVSRDHLEARWPIASGSRPANEVRPRRRAERRPQKARPSGERTRSRHRRALSR